MKAISRAAIALSLCVPPSLVCGQTVSAPILIGTPTDPGRVVFTSSVAANPVAPMAVTAAWEEVDAGRVVGSRVYVAQTSNAWQTTAVAALPMSACSGTSQQTLHPMTARSVHDNSVYVAALESVTGSQRAYTISRRPTGGALETVGHPFQCASYPNGAIDGALFVGPRAPDPMNLGDAVHIIHNLFRSPSCGSSGGPGWSAMAGNRSEDAAGQIWLQPFPGYRVQLPGQDDCQLAGAEISAIVIQDSLFRGRIITAELQTDGMIGPAASYNSRDGGTTWELTEWVTSYGSPGSEVYISHPYGSEILGGFPASSSPKLAAHPTSATVVYMLFSAVEWTTPSNNNLDLYLARLSLDPFSQAMRFTPADTIRLTDSLLGEPAGADQIIGNVAVDAYGGINLVYYSVSPDGRYPYGDGSLPSYTPRYARFSRFPAPSSSFGLKLANLAPAFNPLAAPFTSSSTVIFPEYHGITSSGCMVYTTYMSAHSGTYGIYVNAINLCIADTSVDGFVTEVDPPIFADQYVTHNSAADLNYDGVIDAADVLIFQTSYQCGCGAP